MLQHNDDDDFEELEDDQDYNPYIPDLLKEIKHFRESFDAYSDYEPLNHVDWDQWSAPTRLLSHAFSDIALFSTLACQACIIRWKCNHKMVSNPMSVAQFWWSLNFEHSKMMSMAVVEEGSIFTNCQECRRWYSCKEDEALSHQQWNTETWLLVTREHHEWVWSRYDITQSHN